MTKYLIVNVTASTNVPENTQCTTWLVIYTVDSKTMWMGIREAKKKADKKVAVKRGVYFDMPGWTAALVNT